MVQVGNEEIMGDVGMLLFNNLKALSYTKSYTL
jgi:hypothetical protein